MVGGVISGTRLEGVNGKFTGILEVEQLIGSNLIESVSKRISKIFTYRDKSIKFKIKPKNINRNIIILYTGFYKRISDNEVESVIDYITLNGNKVEFTSFLPKNTVGNYEIFVNEYINRFGMFNGKNKSYSGTLTIIASIASDDKSINIIG